ncbi:YolD-like family protein [Ureibacillus acetophenoni]|uniref:YolD-like protein n=1 Tax=Ureibacillus acetophenoni TaxID=614649 RepID=A0A285UD11_9BACL|nr:YolD-like family protein [Ureibacillus acetophenoni]SOC39587.1 YolD-like protein [Ureibacillus acetophenoni]
MIRDRGNIKWTAMMLPEHVKLLREWQEQDKYVKKPELDEWALQELSEQLQLAYNQKREVELKVWEEKQIYKATGIITKLNQTNATLYLEDGRAIPFHSIFGVSLTIAE